MLEHARRFGMSGVRWLAVAPCYGDVPATFAESVTGRGDICMSVVARSMLIAGRSARRMSRQAVAAK